MTRLERLCALRTNLKAVICEYAKLKLSPDLDINLVEEAILDIYAPRTVDDVRRLPADPELKGAALCRLIAECELEEIARRGEDPNDSDGYCLDQVFGEVCDTPALVAEILSDKSIVTKEDLVRHIEAQLFPAGI